DLERNASERLDPAEALHDVDSFENPGSDLRAGCQKAHQATLRRFAGAFQGRGQLSELLVADQSALLRAQVLDPCEQGSLGVIVEVETELVGLQPDGVDAALLAEHDAARGPHNL